jgi:hypothetical protein
MSTADMRRLDRIEGSLTPKQAFLLWLEEARAHESFSAYVLSMRGQPIEQHPYRRLPRQVEQAVRDRCKAEGQPSDSRFPRPSERKARREMLIEAEVIAAVREIAFFLELHSGLTSRFAAEWRALALQLLLALGESRQLWKTEEQMQEQIDRTRTWVVQSAGDLLMWESVANQVAEKYTDGRSLLFPEQERRLAESIESANWLVAVFEDHMSWLQYLRKGKKKTWALDLEPIDVDELHSAVEREATATAEQIVTMAKAEAASYVGQRELAVELLDRVLA